MHDWQGVRALLGGPVIFMIFVGALAIVIMLAAFLRRLDSLFFHASRAADRLQKNFTTPLMWGTAAVVLVTVIGIKLLQLPPHTRLIGVLVMLLMLSLSGIGGGVTALALGRAVTVSSRAVADDDLTAVRLGLSIFFAAEFVPIAGWILVFLAGCAGSAAFLESLFQKQSATPNSVS
jgi:hypothetical protein